MKIICGNPKAYHNYFIQEEFECGIELKGTEVKSLLQRKASIKEAICKIFNNECYILGMHISPYENGNIWNHDEIRTRKLLLHKKEINNIAEQLKLKGFTLIPLEVYFNNRGKVKIKIGLAKGKKLYDKRETEKKKSIKKNLADTMKKTIKGY